MHEVCHKSYEINCLKCNVKILGIKPLVQLEACNVAHTTKQSETRSTQCVPSNHEVNNGVFVECVIKMDTRILSTIMPYNFASNSTKVHGKFKRSWKELMETKLDHKGKYLIAQGLSGRAGCSWRWTTFRKTCQGSNKLKQKCVAYDDIWSTFNFGSDSRSIW